MAIGVYLYSAAITIVCTVLLCGFFAEYMRRRDWHSFLMAALYAAYLISEVARIILMLVSNASAQLPMTVAQLEESFIVSLYHAIVWEQVRTEPSKRALPLLLVPVAALLLLPQLPFTAPAAPYIILGIFILGSALLFPHRRRDARTRGMFFAVTVLAAYLLIYEAVSLFVPLDSILSSLSPFALSLFYREIILYIVVGFSFADLLYSYRAAKQVLPEPPPAPEMPAGPSPAERVAAAFYLTAREREVFVLLVQGKSNKEISGALGISEGTVKVHIHNIYQKLDITNRRQINQLLMDYSDGSIFEQ